MAAEEAARLDVRPTPLDNLRAQGGTPTTKALADVPRERGYGADTPEDKAQDGTAALICAYPWPQGCDYWIGVAWCESTLGQDPWAYDDRNPYVGLFQVWIGHNYERGWLKDDANNVLAAWELSHEGTRTSPWPYCS